MSLHEIFADPPAMYRQAPFWFWNHRLDPEMLGWQIEQMKEKGLGGFVMHARHGLITPYLGEAWFACIKHCCTKARELGMTAWAYDERDWPSGPAGGAVIAQPENRLGYLRYESEAHVGHGTASFGADVVAAYADGERVPLEGWKPARDHCTLAKAVRFECPAILWFETYLDTLNPEACDAFIRSTYDRHEAVLGDLKALGLAGFFTDEPAFSTYPDDLGRIPWTPKLPEAFFEQKGYDLLDCLPDLFANAEAGAQVRYDYWDVATGLFEAAFFKRIGAWCEQRGLQLIGHPLGEEPMFYQFRCVGNVFYHLKHMHMPGMDHVTGTVPTQHPLGIVPKLITSAALLAGRERTMTETFGESGWGLSLRTMKAMADWQMVHGINYFVPHAFYYSIGQRRKKDSPPSEFYQAPFWPCYRTFADYTARVTAAMTGGEHVAPIAVLFPMASIWADFVPGGETPPDRLEAEQGFAPLCRTLLELHRDFVVVDEANLAEARAVDGGFEVNGLHFEALVIPPLTHLCDSTLEAVTRAAESALVIAAGVDEVRVLRTAPGAPLEPVRLSAIDGIVAAGGLGHAAMAEALAGLTPDVTLEGAPEVHYLHRRKDGLDLYFFANLSETPVKAAASLAVCGYAERWDPETGANAPLEGQQARGGRLEFPLELPAPGSALIAVDPAKPVVQTPVVEFTPGVRVRLCDVWEFTPENGNALTLQRWDLMTRTRHKTTELRYTTSFMTTAELANLRVILDGVPGKAYGVHEAARPMMAHETDAQVLLDHKPVTAEKPWEVDLSFRVLDLEGLCGPGSHDLTVVVQNHGWFPQPGLEEYVWLAGDFAVEGASGAPCLVPIRGIRKGPWEEQGFPNFSGTGAYYATVELPRDIEGKPVFLEPGRVGDLLEAEVNGRDLAVRAWPPYRVDLRGWVHPGVNTFVLKVSNTLRDFLEGPDPHHPSGLLDDVYIEIG